MFVQFDRGGQLLPPQPVEAADAADIADALLARLLVIDAPDALEMGSGWRRRPGQPGLAIVWIDEAGAQAVGVAIMCSQTARLVAERIREDPRFAAALSAPDVLAARLVATADKSDADLAEAARKEVH